MIFCRTLSRHSWPRRSLGDFRRWLSATALGERLHLPVQAYVSTSRDPFVNLSIEHYLLQKSAPESAIVFQYINRPSIIIGRNQNPWLEVNLALLDHLRDQPETEPPSLGAVDLVRRRSGGGTVFHDEGNVNWTVICPSAQFTRDKHVEMVVRALRSCGIDRARVNVRHDVVLDQGERVADTDPEDTHVTPFSKSDEKATRPIKVSGSAYKLTRGRALHHGTCLLSSPNLNVIPHYLHSPAKPYIHARGVESVSSPVGNTLVEHQDFMDAVQSEFTHLYNGGRFMKPDELGEDLAGLQFIRDGVAELKSLDWFYLQTPQFTVSNAADDTSGLELEMAVRHGVITSGQIGERGRTEAADFQNTLIGQRLHELSSWNSFFERQSWNLDVTLRSDLYNWLQKALPLPHVRRVT